MQEQLPSVIRESCLIPPDLFASLPLRAGTRATLDVSTISTGLRNGLFRLCLSVVGREYFVFHQTDGVVVILLA